MPKLPRGMYRRGGAFYCRLHADGREVRRSLGGDYERACQKLRALKGSTELGAPRMSVADAVAQWLGTAIRTGRNTQGLRDATSRAEHHLLPYLGHRPLSAVTGNDLRRFRIWLEDQGRSVSLVHHVLTDTRALFRWCEGSGFVGKSPVPPRWLPRLPERVPDRLTEEEAQAVSRVPDPHGFVVRLALGTGLRWGELARLEARDIWDGIVLVGQSKSGKVRRVPLTSAMLREVVGKTGRLVPFSKPESVARFVRRHTGVRQFHMHQTRHTFACRYLERGGSLHALQQLLGHGSVLVTQRYARLSDQAVLKECRMLDSSLLGGEGRTGTETGTPPPSLPAPESDKPM